MNSHQIGPRPGIVRKRSTSTMDPRGHDGFKYSHDVPEAPDRLPAWQVALLLVGTIGLLYGTLSVTHPRARAAKAMASHAPPKCFELDDKDRVRLLGSQNTLVNRTIATTSEWAQVLFNLGLLAAHGFNQIEAAKNFQACLRADPTCAMCYWGLAYAQGPMPNKVPGKLSDPFPTFLPTHATDAYTYIQQALNLNKKALDSQLDAVAVRRDGRFIEALAQRFTRGAGALKGGRWREHEAAYAAVMQQIAEEEQDADAFALAAEALMCLSPWDYYAPDGSLRPNAQAAEQLLLKALQLQPQHTHALHLHVHVAEAGTAVAQPANEALSAARALGSATTLAQLNSQNGHLLHMPSHIFARVGQYKRAVMVNKAAYDFDMTRGGQCVTPYLPEHNLNMLVFSASMAGMYHTAEAFATGMRNLRDRVPDTWMAKGSEWVSMPTLHIRYGEWGSLLHSPAPPRDARGVTALGGAQYAAVLHHAGRALASAAHAQAAAAAVLGVEDETVFDLARKSLELREKEFAHEQRQLQSAAALIPPEPLTRPGAPPGMYASAYQQLAQLTAALVAARQQLLRNNSAAAVELLADAVRVELGLGYMEPPRVHQPLRQCLGWVLLQAGRQDEAWRVYSQDLQQHPNNGWSLLGLMQVAAARGEGLTDASQRFEAAWGDAEVQIDSSCPALSRPYTEPH